MSLREDWLKRTIRQLADAFARLSGLRKAGRTEEALEATRTLAGDLLGLDRSVLDSLDAPSAARLLGAERADVYARLLDEDALTLEAAKRPDEARSLRARAAAVRG